MNVSSSHQRGKSGRTEKSPGRFFNERSAPAWLPWWAMSTTKTCIETVSAFLEKKKTIDHITAVTKGSRTLATTRVNLGLIGPYCILHNDIVVYK
jgi:hypothetical protein